MLIFNVIRLKPAKKRFFLLKEKKWTSTGLVFCLSIIININLFAQCPHLNLKNTKISLDKNLKELTITTTSEIDFSSLRVMLWEYDEGVYYYDSWKREKVRNSSSISVNIFNKNISIQNLPSGDFLIVIERQGCKKQAIGLGYSGFPSSAIRIE